MSEPEIRDPHLFAQAARFAVTVRTVGPGQIQRKVRVGWARAVFLMDELRDAGIIGERDAKGCSTVLAAPDSLAAIFTANGIEETP